MGNPSPTRARNAKPVDTRSPINLDSFQLYKILYFVIDMFDAIYCNGEKYIRSVGELFLIYLLYFYLVILNDSCNIAKLYPKMAQYQAITLI